MKWIITQDVLHAGEARTMVGHTNRGRLTAESQAEFLAQHQGRLVHEFRLRDDDGNVYFTGLCEDLDQQDGDSAFGPLDCAGEPFGCTEMQYRKAGTQEKWFTL